MVFRTTWVNLGISKIKEENFKNEKNLHWLISQRWGLHNDDRALKRLRRIALLHFRQLNNRRTPMVSRLVARRVSLAHNARDITVWRSVVSRDIFLIVFA